MSRSDRADWPPPGPERAVGCSMVEQSTTSWIQQLGYPSKPAGERYPWWRGHAWTPTSHLRRRSSKDRPPPDGSKPSVCRPAWCDWMGTPSPSPDGPRIPKRTLMLAFDGCERDAILVGI